MYTDAVAVLTLYCVRLQDPQRAAKKLTDEAYGRGSNDNISCIVVRFNF